MSALKSHTPATSKRSKITCIKLASQAVLIALTAQFASAVTYTWDGGDGTNPNTSEATNWSTDIAPAATGDNLVFDGTNNLNVSNNHITSLTSTSFTFASGAGSFNIGGNAITIGNGASNDNIITKVSTNDQTISANLNLAGGGRDRTIVMTGGGTLSLTGNINYSNDWLFPTTAAGTIVLSGNNSGDGKGSVLVSGTNSSRTMMRNNVAGTTLVLGSDTALGNSGTGDIALGTANFRGLVANQNMTLATTGGNRNLSGSSVIINTASVTYNSTNSLSLGNLIVQGGNRDFVVSNSGGVTIANGIVMSNDQTGRAIYVNLTGAGGMVVNGKLYDTFHSGGITTGTSNFRKAGTGTLTLNGDSSNYNGTLSFEGGTTILGHANALGATGTTKGTTVRDGATLDLNGFSLAETLSTNGSGGTLVNSASAVNLSADMNLFGALTVNNTSDITATRLVGNATRLVTKQGSGTLTTNGSSHNNLTQWDIQAGTVVFANTSGLASDRGTTISGGTLRLSGANSNLINDGQAFTINSGTFDLNGKGEAVAAINGTGGIVTNSAVTASTLYVGGGVSGTSSGAYAGVIQNGTGTMNVTKEGTGLQIFTATNTYTGATTVNKGTLQIDGSITSPVTVNNTGIFSGSGVVSGPITVAAGGAVAPGSSGINSGIGNLTSSGNVDLGSTTTAYNWDFDNNGAVGIGGTNFDLLTLTGPSATLSLGGYVNVSLTSGDFTNAFWDTNQSFQITNVTNTGGTTGTMSVIAAGSAGQGIFSTSVSGGNLMLNWTAIAGIGVWIGNSGDSWGNAPSWQSGSVPLSNYNHEFGAAGAGGIVNLDAVRTVSNPMTLSLANGSGGSYVLAAGTGGSLDLVGDINVNVASASESHTISAPINGTGSLTKSGDGSLVISGTNNYAGVTTIGAGTLVLGSSSSLGATPTVVTSSAGTLDLNGNSQSLSSLSGTGGTVTSGSSATLSLAQTSTTTYSGVITGAVNVNKNGSGTITLSGVNTYSGDTTLASGTIIIPNNQYSPFGSGVVTLAGSSSSVPVIIAQPASGGYLTTNASRIANDVVVQAGSVNVIDDSVNPFGNLWIGGTWTGTGKVIFQNTHPGTQFQASGAMLFIGDKLGGFQGTIELGTVANPNGRAFAFVAMNDDGSSPVSQWDASQTRFILGDNPTGGAGIVKWNQSANGGTVKLGSIEGQTATSALQAGNSVNTTFEVGALNTSTTFAGQVQDGTSGGVASLTKVGTGTLTLTAAHTFTGTTTVSAGTLKTVIALQNNAPVVATTGGKLEVAANGGSTGVMRVSSVDTTSGKIDLHDNDMIVDYGANPSSYASILNQVKNGLALLGGTDADSNGIGDVGIGSSDVDLQTVGGTFLAVVDDGDPLISGAITTLSGLNIPNPTSSVLVKYTWFGDSNLDGVVDGSDYALIDTGFTSGGALGGWVFGDYDYSGTVDGSDYALIDTGFISQTGALPEPGTLGLLGMGAIGMMRRRRNG